MLSQRDTLTKTLNHLYLLPIPLSSQPSLEVDITDKDDTLSLTSSTWESVDTGICGSSVVEEAFPLVDDFDYESMYEDVDMS